MLAAASSTNSTVDGWLRRYEPGHAGLMGPSTEPLTAAAFLSSGQVTTKCLGFKIHCMAVANPD